ncbi:hypothetical protein BD408DRAFT_359697 [Parasitella parasitica]|nr:hypothetical protein BD408DRAFT_359697 [Parasitella parasitica]
MKQTRQDSYNSSEVFSPPLWRQRRNFIQDVLNRFDIETVLDYGCGEASVLAFLISPTENKLTKIAGIDIDHEALKEAVDRCLPYKSDFQHLRLRPLVIDIFQGSVGIADDRLKNYQAIVCSEVIEHVYPDVLDRFLELTLGVYHPEVLIVTTPNGEYNVNFPDLKYNTPESMFRHDDHKFEWTRKEFEAWCEEGVKKYNYKAEYHGIGLLHQKCDNLENGHCTQACVFTRSADFTLPNNDTVHGTPHQLLKHIEFPYCNEEAPSSDQIIKELDYFIESLCKAEYYMNEEPTKGFQSKDVDQQQPIDLDITAIDWETFDLSKYGLQQEEQPSPNIYTPIKSTSSSSTDITPIHISISSLWCIPRLQQICESKEKMIEILQASDVEGGHYQVMDNDSTLAVSKSFDWAGDNESVKSFSSKEDW